MGLVNSAIWESHEMTCSDVVALSYLYLSLETAMTISAVRCAREKS